MDRITSDQYGFEGLDEACEHLARKLAALHANELPVLPSPAKDRIRAHMFERIEGLQGIEVPALTKASIAPGGEEDSESYLIDRLISWMKGQAEKVSLSPAKKALIGEKLYELPALHSLPIFRAGFFRRFAASLSLGGVFAMSVFAFMLRVPVTFAQEFTVVHETSGDVTVVRGDELLSASPGFQLQEGDRLQTGSSGQAVVRYFDRSFTRFFGNTGVNFNALKSENFGIDHRVELDLQHGKIWSNVLDFVSNSEFTVKSGSLVASASKRATFSLSSDEGVSQLQVFQNVVNVGSRTVLNGYQAVTSSSGGVVVKPLALAREEKNWVSQNLVKDEKLAQEAQKDIKGVVAGPSNVLQENASLLLAFSSSERYRLELSLAEKNFYDVLQRDGSSVDEVRTVFRSLEDVAARWATFQDENLKKMADAVLQSARGKLLTVSPESGLYALKVELEDRVLASSDESNKALIALDQASQFLIEAQLFRGKGLQDEFGRALSGFRDRVKIVDNSDLLNDVASSSDVSAKRRELEKMYLAFNKPVVIVSSETELKNDVPEVAVTEPAQVSSEGEPGGTVAEAPVVDRPAAESSVSDNVATSDSAPSQDASSEEVSDTSQLPPKLQLSQE